MNFSQARPSSIRIFLADGTPDGIRIVEKSNWTGRAVVAGRSQLAKASAREEMARPGVYVLLGPGDDGASRLYVGEADVLAQRLKQQARDKDFWTRFIAFTSTDGNLNKAHVRYLEARLLGLAKDANQWELDNSTVPMEPPLSEADRADGEWFLAEMRQIYPILGVDAFEAATSEDLKGGAPEILQLSGRGAQGKGWEVAGGFVVQAGSRARGSEVPSIPGSLHDLRSQLQHRGVLTPEGKYLLFTQDFRFTSPSTAAGVLVGGSTNGRRAWKNAAGVSLKKIQDASTEATP